MKSIGVVISLVLIIPIATTADLAEDNLAEGRELILERFSSADIDADGNLTRSETEKGMPYVYTLFDKVDFDEDDHITLVEILTAYEIRNRQKKDKLMLSDKNEDGFLSKSEIDARLIPIDKLFGNIDGNRDNIITETEIDKYYRPYYFDDLPSNFDPELLPTTLFQKKF